MQLKIGLLMPSSEYYPTLAGDFMNGIRFAFREISSPQLLFEGIGNGTDEKALRAAEKFILQDNVDAVIGFCGHNRIEALVGLFDAYQKPFVHTDFGANIYSVSPSPYTVHQSLHLWQCCYYLGKYAGPNGQKVALTASFYEAGYQLYYAFCEGLAQNNGNVLLNQIVGADYKNYDFEAMMANIASQKPDAVFNLFSYKEGNMVLEKLQVSVAKNIDTAFNPIMLNEFKGIDSAATFTTVTTYGAESEAMKDFMDNYKIQYRKPPNEIALLGYESGLNVIASFQKGDNAIAQNLQNTSITSPRGQYYFDEGNRATMVDYYLIKIKNKVVSQQKIETNPNQITHLLSNSPQGGWLNPYLCT